MVGLSCWLVSVFLSFFFGASDASILIFGSFGRRTLKIYSRYPTKITRKTTITALIAVVFCPPSPLSKSQINGQEKNPPFSDQAIWLIGVGAFHRRTFNKAETIINKEKKYFIKNFAKCPLTRINTPIKIQSQKKKSSPTCPKAILLYLVKNVKIGESCAIVFEKKYSTPRIIIPNQIWFLLIL